MQGRQVIILVIAVACLVVAGIRMGGLFSHKRENHGLPPDMRRTWTCRADGLVTNLTGAEIDALFAAGKTRLDPANLAVQLLECPKCGKMELEMVVIPVGQAGEP